MNSSEMAKLIVSEIYGTPNTYLFICLVIVLSGMAAWGLRFLEKKAENYVTREDFQKLQEQLERSTRLVEGIKSEVQHNDWARREWFSFRSKKLEELATAVNALCHSLATSVQDVPNGRIDSYVEFTDRTWALAQLYFPELMLVVADYRNACREMALSLHACNMAHKDGTSFDHDEILRKFDVVRTTQEVVHIQCAQLLQKSAVQAGLQ